VPDLRTERRLKRSQDLDLRILVEEISFGSGFGGKGDGGFSSSTSSTRFLITLSFFSTFTIRVSNCSMQEEICCFRFFTNRMGSNVPQAISTI